MTKKPNPTIVIVPGAWQRVTAFAPFADRLQKAGYDTRLVAVPSVGGTELPLTGLPEDVAAVRAVLAPLVEHEGREVVVLTHSAGGVSGSAAVRGLDAESRRRAGSEGGVVRVIYMAAFMIPKGASIMEMLGGAPPPWMIIEGDRVTGDGSVLPELALHDLSPADQQEAFTHMTHTSAVLFAGESEFEPWSEGVPCAYIFATQDGCIPLPLQEKMASQLAAGSPTASVDTNHCPFLSKPDELLQALEKVVAA